MTPADEGIAAAKADNEATRLALAELNAREIKRRAASVLADLKQCRDPAFLDPSDLDEIGRELEQLQKIAEGSWRERSQRFVGAEAPEEFPTEGAATGGYVGRYYRGRRMTDGSRFWPTPRPICQHIVGTLKDPVAEARSLCSGSENIHKLSGDAALDEARIILLSLKPGTSGHDRLLDAFLAAGISTDIDEPKADLDLLDNGDGFQALGFEMSLAGLNVEVVIKNSCGQLPDEGENLAALYIDGDERARLTGNFEKVTRWARVIKRELEELQERDQLRFVSWSRFARAFDGVLR